MPKKEKKKTKEAEAEQEGGKPKKEKKKTKEAEEAEVEERSGRRDLGAHMRGGVFTGD